MYDVSGETNEVTLKSFIKRQLKFWNYIMI